MNKLLLSSVSVMAFVSAATAASQTTQPSPTHALQQAAKHELEAVMTLPAIEMFDLVQQQALFALNEENQRRLGKGLYVLNDKHASRREAKSE